MLSSESKSPESKFMFPKRFKWKDKNVVNFNIWNNILNKIRGIESYE